MIIYYVRHGDPIYNPDSLTEFGSQQAELLSERLSALSPTKIFTSTSNRAYLTAKPTCDKVGIEPVRLDWANEGIIARHFFVSHEGRGTWVYNHKYWQQIFNSGEVLALGDKWYDHPAFAETSFKQGIVDFQKAQDDFLASLGYVHDRENHFYKAVNPNNDVILFFAHGGCGQCFMSGILDIPYNVYSTHFHEHATTGTSVIKLDGDNDFIIPKVMAFDETSHLYKHGVKNQFKI